MDSIGGAGATAVKSWARLSFFEQGACDENVSLLVFVRSRST